MLGLRCMLMLGPCGDAHVHKTSIVQARRKVAPREHCSSRLAQMQYVNLGSLGLGNSRIAIVPMLVLSFTLRLPAAMGTGWRDRRSSIACRGLTHLGLSVPLGMA